MSPLKIGVWFFPFEGRKWKEKVLAQNYFVEVSKSIIQLYEFVQAWHKLCKNKSKVSWKKIGISEKKLLSEKNPKYKTSGVYIPTFVESSGSCNVL